MILCMPTVGEKVRVVDDQDWTFTLYWESRNDSLFEYLNIVRPERRTFYDDYEGGEEAYTWGENRPSLKSNDVTIPAGSVLTIDRIFLRKGAEEFDSITFILNGAKLPGKKGVHARVRFWAKLDDVNSGKLQLLPKE